MLPTICRAAAAALLLTAPATFAGDLSDASGAELYERFCAACHGRDGRGDGPVADWMAVMVPDLTEVAARRGGEFPYDRIRQIVDGRWPTGSHGSREMPVWGYEFWVVEGGDAFAEAEAQKILDRLVDYLESLQRSRD